MNLPPQAKYISILVLTTAFSCLLQPSTSLILSVYSKIPTVTGDQQQLKVSLYTNFTKVEQHYQSWMK